MRQTPRAGRLGRKRRRRRRFRGASHVPERASRPRWPARALSMALLGPMGVEPWVVVTRYGGSTGLPARSDRPPTGLEPPIAVVRSRHRRLSPHSSAACQRPAVRRSGRMRRSTDPRGPPRSPRSRRSNAVRHAASPLSCPAGPRRALRDPRRAPLPRPAVPAPRKSETPQHPAPTPARDFRFRKSPGQGDGARDPLRSSEGRQARWLTTDWPRHRRSLIASASMLIFPLMKRHFAATPVHPCKPDHAQTSPGRASVSRLSERLASYRCVRIP